MRTHPNTLTPAQVVRRARKLFNTCASLAAKEHRAIQVLMASSTSAGFELGVGLEEALSVSFFQLIFYDLQKKDAKIIIRRQSLLYSTNSRQNPMRPYYRVLSIYFTLIQLWRLVSLLELNINCSKPHAFQHRGAITPLN